MTATTGTSPPAEELDDRDGDRLRFLRGQQMPRRLRLSDPDEKIEVDLQLKERVWGKPTSPATFQLVPPQGVKIVEVD